MGAAMCVGLEKEINTQVEEGVGVDSVHNDLMLAEGVVLACHNRNSSKLDEVDQCRLYTCTR